MSALPKALAGRPGPGAAVARWRFSPREWAVLLFALVVAFIPFANVLQGLFEVWNLKPEYSHGILIPILSLFLLWRQRDALAHTPFNGSWAGLPLIVLGGAMWYVAQLSTIYVIGQYAFLAVLYGLVLSLVGWEAFRQLRTPLLILIFMIPLPAFLSNRLSLQLQLISSAIGAGVIRLLGITVFLEGNVIDLGTYQLQVAEACSGLRYLLPLMTLAFLLACFFRAPLWKRIVLFAASIPVAVLMNSLRIGLIGITVEFGGQKMAEGLLHFFEGWVVFMLSTGVLLLVAAALARIGARPARLRDVLILDFGTPLTRADGDSPRTLPPSFLAATALATIAAVLSFVIPQRVELLPARAQFAQFPANFAGRDGTFSRLADVYSDQLKVDDYLLADYRGASRLPINVWVAYYNSQREGQSTHSPKSCLPGGGWEFRTLEERRLQTPAGELSVNRAVIQNGSDRGLMYYWFQQRGRVVTDEYLVKWFIFRDALARNRTDGALVRVLTPLPAGMPEGAADRELTQFVGALRQELSRYVPD